jgi:hypothetical protein
MTRAAALLGSAFGLVPQGDGDLKRGTLRAIIAQAGMTVAEFAALL